jgi:hypothetical protein
MENDLIESGPSDPAALAFDKLRREVTTLRLAIERMTDEPEKIEIPDYNDTLSKIAQRTGMLAKHLAELKDAPALATTPNETAREIVAAGTTARAEDHAALGRAISAFDHAEKSITSSLASARTAQEQENRLKRVSINCLIAGMIIWAILPGMIIRAMPESWQLPERMAAWAIGGEPWEAGQRILAYADRARWQLHWVIDDETDDGRKALTNCQKAAGALPKTKRCMVMLRTLTE